MKRTPSKLPNTKRALTDKEKEVDKWVEGLQKEFPDIKPYFLRHLANAYQINPKKFDNIVENNVKVEPIYERQEACEIKNIKVYKNLNELKLEEKKSESI
jgi:hypothetical protein